MTGFSNFEVGFINSNKLHYGLYIIKNLSKQKLNTTPVSISYTKIGGKKIGTKMANQ